MKNELVILEPEEIRKALHGNEWWYVVEDVVRALAKSSDPKQYVRHIKQQDPELGKGGGKLSSLF